MKRSATAILLAGALFGFYRPAVAQSGSQPYKLGTFERNGQTFLGVVLGDSQIIDLAQANAALESRDSSASRLAMPADMKELISRYESGLKGRIAAIVSQVSSAASAPSYVYTLDSLETHPPVRPSLILNAGGNYAAHTQGIAEQQRRSGATPDPSPAPAAVSAPGIWERRAGDDRSNPYLFIKSPTVVTGPYDPIRMPLGRDHIDFECEFATVIGKPAKHVSIDDAADYIFGYTIEIDVSDRGGRGDRKMGGSDWLVGKNHDTFAPLGPFIVPKEFVANPLNTPQKFTLNGQVMQDSNTSRMVHNIYELLHYASNILTLHPGDIISGGSPSGTNIERAEPRWMRTGDNAVCTIQGVGEQRHPIVAPMTSPSQ
jgi:2-keto-4-pentenoate hydratase/2-oxohepta-3-ene-1,7-dioic acid hydratase in catechol pathway